jgi:hypothetical protein
VARNAIVDQARTRFDAVAEAVDSPSGEPGPAEQAESGWVSWRVHRALDDLPERERTLIELAYWSGLSQAEIATRLDVPLGTVKTQTRRPLARLAELSSTRICTVAPSRRWSAERNPPDPVYAQALEGADTARLNEIVQRELLPALRTEPGFSGALSLVDHATGRAVVLVFWETEDEAARLLPPYYAGLLAALELPDPETYAPPIWEVGARA